ncbi:MAG: DoxX family protein [Hyphomonadaceae bacterium]|nr:DoxX family protein [Hyphomonadaceae bacterium]
MKTKYVYWIATGLLALIYIAGGIMYLTNLDWVRGAFAALGYPSYLVPFLAVAKLGAAVTILWRFSVALSDLAYAAMLFHLLLAVSAHVAAADMGFGPAVVGLIALAVSFATQNAARKSGSPYGPIGKIV